MVEVTNISPHGIWVFIGGKEYLLPFEKFPWFKKATIEQIQNVESPHPGHLYWPALDIDLHEEILAEPDKYPLVSKFG